MYIRQRHKKFNNLVREEIIMTQVCPDFLEYIWTYRQVGDSHPNKGKKIPQPKTISIVLDIYISLIFI